MGLFKETNCVHCGKKAGLLSRFLLGDEQVLCKSCISGIPAATVTELGGHTYEEFVEVREYMDITNKELEKTFRENHSFRCLHIDTQHKIFYIDTVSPKTYFKFENISNFNLEFVADEVKDGMFGAKVTGKIYLKLELSMPYFFMEEIIDNSAKAAAKISGVLSKKVTYENPKGMDDFLRYFTGCWSEAAEEKVYRLEREIEELYSQRSYYQTEEDPQPVQPAHPSELQQAMALFMIDDLSNVTLNDVKSQRNRLIKTFHPDHGSSDDTGYAQKINAAYEILKEHLS